MEMGDLCTMGMMKVYIRSGRRLVAYDVYTRPEGSY